MSDDLRIVHNENAIKEIKTEIKELTKRITILENSQTKTDFQYEQIMEMLKIINEKTIPNLITDIEELKHKPAKRYEQVVTGILSGVVGIIIGIVSNLFLNK